MKFSHRLTNLCYQDIESSVINNGFTSVWFKFSRGTRQGDPLSSLIFNLVAEMLAHKIGNNNSIEDVTARQNVHGQYMDDIWLVI